MFADIIYEDLFSQPADDPVQIHCVALIGAYSIFVSLTMLLLSLFQPSNNARKTVLVCYALMQGINISTEFRFPIKEGEPPESFFEMPIPLLLGLMSIALIGAIFSQTDRQKHQMLRAQAKVKLYSKHLNNKVKQSNKGD